MSQDISDDDGPMNVCYKCGKTELVLEEEEDKPSSRDRLNCPECEEPGPYCEKCITHHLKHCRGVDIDEISNDEDCSDCSEGEEEDGEYEKDFIDNDL